MRGKRARIILVAVVVVLVVAAWVPVLIAERYADGPGGADIGHARLDRGWEFVYQAVRLSRGARLGDDELALHQARQVWAGPPALAQSVDLVYMDGPFRVPVPQGGVPPAPDRATAEPLSRLGWVVRGRVCDGPPQPIGILDYPTGRVAWNIRPLAPCP
jgi:hypothetical protein